MKERKDPATKIEESNAKYSRSEKGKAVRKRYNLSDKGKETRRRYQESEKGQAALLRYYFSDKGEEHRKRQNDKYRLMAECSKFLEDNPGKTTEDFLNSLKEEDNGTSL